jgi:aspartate kinase
MTDELLKEKGEISTKENLREQDVLLATGEQITIAKLSMCLSDLGYKAISLLGWQVPIITDSNYGDANIIDIKTDRILKELKEEKIVIIAGFQGVTRDNNITTLGRRRI